MSAPSTAQTLSLARQVIELTAESEAWRRDMDTKAEALRVAYDTLCEASAGDMHPKQGMEALAILREAFPEELAEEIAEFNSPPSDEDDD